MRAAGPDPQLLSILAINGRTLELWRGYLEMRLEGETDDRLKRAVEAYFEFAIVNRNAWTAIYDFRLPEDVEPPQDYQDQVTAIFDIVVAELTRSLPADRTHEAAGLARSLLAVVHGHCIFTLNGTFAILGEGNPLATALDRVKEVVQRN